MEFVTESGIGERLPVRSPTEPSTTAAGLSMSSLIHAYRTTLLCSVLAFGMTACTSKQDPTNTTPPTPIPTAIVKVDGDTQSGTVGTALGTSLVVQVNDQTGTAMEGVSVSFSVTSGGGRNRVPPLCHHRSIDCHRPKLVSLCSDAATLSLL